MEANISNVIREYMIKKREKSPHLNEAALSKQMKIPATTFNRLLNGHSRPNLVTTLKLLQFIPELRHHLPQEVAQMMEVTLSQKNSEFVESKWEDCLYDGHNFLCLALTICKKGTTKEEIKDLMGSQGVKALDLLERKNMVKQVRPGRYRSVMTDKNFSILSLPLIKNHIKTLIDQFNVSKEGSNYIHYQVDSLSPEGVEELKKMQKEMHQRVQQIAKKHQGDIPVFALGSSAVLLEKEV